MQSLGNSVAQIVSHTENRVSNSNQLAVSFYLAQTALHPLRQCFGNAFCVIVSKCRLEVFTNNKCQSSLFQLRAASLGNLTKLLLVTSSPSEMKLQKYTIDKERDKFHSLSNLGDIKTSFRGIFCNEVVETKQNCRENTGNG